MSGEMAPQLSFAFKIAIDVTSAACSVGAEGGAALRLRETTLNLSASPTLA